MINYISIIVSKFVQWTKKFPMTILNDTFVGILLIKEFAYKLIFDGYGSEREYYEERGKYRI